MDDNQIQHMQDFECDKKSFDSDSLQSKMLHSKHNVYITIPNNRSLVEDKVSVFSVVCLCVAKGSFNVYARFCLEGGREWEPSESDK